MMGLTSFLQGSTEIIKNIDSQKSMFLWLTCSHNKGWTFAFWLRRLTCLILASLRGRLGCFFLFNKAGFLVLSGLLCLVCALLYDLPHLFSSYFCFAGL